MSYSILGIGEVEGSEPIIKDGNFTWNEATRNGSRLPVDKEVTDRIILAAEKMQEIRKLLGDKPITVTSWYRPPLVNKAVRGASNSQHLLGWAVDFVHSELKPLEVYRRLDNWHKGGLGKANTFTHIDLRRENARWDYFTSTARSRKTTKLLDTDDYQPTPEIILNECTNYMEFFYY
jgi:hypothetical protein